VLNLILALANEPAARSLPSRISDRTLSRDLGILYSRVDTGQVDIALSIPLVEQIVGNAPWNNMVIWHAMFELVARSDLTTPPTTLIKTAFDTPLRSSSAS
jgi:hypothetical protein